MLGHSWGSAAQVDSGDERATSDDVVLLGGLGQSAPIVSMFLLARAAGRPAPRVVGFYDDGEEHDPLFDDLDIPRLGPIVGGPASPTARSVITVGSGALRLDLIESARRLSAGGMAPFVHESTTVALRVEMGAGTVVFGNSWVGARSVLGEHVMLLVGVTTGHGAVIGDGTAVFPNSSVSGDCVIGRGVTIGSHAVVLPGVNVGDRATIGAGAVVNRDVQPGIAVAGVPAQPPKLDSAGTGSMNHHHGLRSLWRAESHCVQTVRVNVGAHCPSAALNPAAFGVDRRRHVRRADCCSSRDS
jgi:sugar O-acyltransferase (sialic acid O-acetyltransferase NeuD family)